MGTRRKINAILLNIKINHRKLVRMCRHKLATYWHNCTEIYLTGVKILQKVLVGATFFDSHCIYKMPLKGNTHIMTLLLMDTLLTLFNVAL